MTYTYYRNRLCLQDQKVYDQLLNGLRERQNVIDIPYTKLAPADLMQGVIADHPELMDVDFRSFQYVDLFLKKYFRMTYTEYDRSAAKKLEQIGELFRSVVNKDMDDWDKAAVIYDTLGSMIRYGFIDGILEHTIKGFLTEGKAVCDGISKMYQYLCGCCGIDCILIQGQVSEEGHAWNLIRLNGHWYHADMTADLKICESAGYPAHVLFCRNDEVFSKDHVWDHSAYPACTQAEDYFEHYHLTAASFLQFSSAVIKARLNGSSRINLKFQTDVPVNMQKLQKWMLLMSITGVLSVVFAEEQQIALILLQ